MNENPQQEAIIVRNLRDAGCSQVQVAQFMESYNANNRDELICLLTAHRGILLNSVHEAQERLDCIDYLLFQLKRKTASPH